MSLNEHSIGKKEVHIKDYSIYSGWIILNNAYRDNISYVTISYRLKNGVIHSCNLYYGGHDFDGSDNDLVISNSALPYFGCGKTITNIILVYSVYERLTWKQIQEKYPDQYVGLINVEYGSDGKIKSAEVKYTDDIGKELNILTIGNDNLISIHTSSNKLLGNRMSIYQIKKKYPDKWLGITSLDADSDTAIPKYFNMSKDELIDLQMQTNGEVLAIYTTPDI